MEEKQQAGQPRDPIVAVTHRDPYPYYARLAVEQPLYRDDRLGLWVASSAEAVTAVLTHPGCRVRPPAEPVPKSIHGSPAGEVFSRLVRMNDGSTHRALKQRASETLDGVDARVAAVSDRWAAQLGPGVASDADASRLTAFAFALPSHVGGALLGIPDRLLGETALLAGDLVRCVFPGGTPDQVERGKAAAGRLLEIFGAQRGDGRDDAEIAVANAIGFLAQAYDATAALIGTTLVTLARRPDLLARVHGSPQALAPIIDEVLRFDSPVQNTRRFLAETAIIAGHELREGDCVLVVLAAANRDPRANPNPAIFDADRRDPRVFTFRVGLHACPARRLASSIARAALEHLLSNGVDPRRLDIEPGYRPLPNCRMPLLTWTGAAGAARTTMPTAMREA